MGQLRLHPRLNLGRRPPVVRIEPMLACIVAGFAMCNLLGRRTELGTLLHSTMPPVLAFFFFTTGAGMTKRGRGKRKEGSGEAGKRGSGKR